VNLGTQAFGKVAFQNYYESSEGGDRNFVIRGKGTVLVSASKAPHGGVEYGRYARRRGKVKGWKVLCQLGPSMGERVVRPKPNLGLRKRGITGRYAG